jgi:hypothetical protein
VATKYWVPGVGSETWTDPSNWNPSGVPTGADDVVFSNFNYNYTVNLGGANCFCKSLSANAPSAFITFDGLQAGSVLNINGSLTFSGPSILWWVLDTVFYSTTTGNTITIGVIDMGFNNNLGVQTIQFNGAGGSWTLGSGFTFGTIDVRQGTFNTLGYNITGNRIISPAGSPRAINFSTNSITLAGSVPWDVDASGLTNNFISSSLAFTFKSPTVRIGFGLTYGGMAFLNGTQGTNVIDGGGTIASLVVAAPDSPGTTALVLTSNLILGSFDLSSATSTSRILIKSNSSGIQRTLFATSWLPAIPNNIDFQDIFWSGTPTPLNLSTTSCGNLGDNTNITFRAGRTVYWNLDGINNWTGNGWALTVSGTPDPSYFPIAQDSVVFGNGSALTAYTVNVQDNFYVNNVTINRTSPFYLNFTDAAKQLYVLGNWTQSGGVVVGQSPAGGAICFANPETSAAQTVTSNGISFGNTTIRVNGGTDSNPNYLQCQDDLTTNLPINIQNGYFQPNGKTVTCKAINTTNTSLATLQCVDFGASTNSKLVLTGFGEVWGYYIVAIGFPTNAIVSCTSSSSKSLNLYNNTYPFTVSNDGIGALSLLNVNGNTSVTLNGLATTVVPTTLTLAASTIYNISTFSVSGSPSGYVGINSTVPGTQATLNKTTGGTVNSSYLTVKDSAATGATWNALLSINNGNNTGWNFTAPPPPTSNPGAFFQLF